VGGCDVGEQLLQEAAFADDAVDGVDFGAVMEHGLEQRCGGCAGWVHGGDFVRLGRSRKACRRSIRVDASTRCQTVRCGVTAKRCGPGRTPVASARLMHLGVSPMLGGAEA